jgi:DNA polymerase III epsilon subunit-like protein
MNSVPFYAVDFETTGLSPLDGARIFEIAAVRVDKPQLEFQTLINCGHPIPPGIEKLCGVTTSDLRFGLTPLEALTKFREFVGKGILIAHNADFERSFLEHEYLLLGWSCFYHFRCSLELSRKFLSLDNYKLATVAKKIIPEMGLKVEHRALPDARVVAAVWNRIKLKEKVVSDA